MGARTKTFLRWTLGVLVVLTLAGVALVLARDPILRRLEERSIYESTGLRAEIGEFHSTLGSTAFVLRDLKLYNLAEFGGSLFARIPELAFDLDAAKAAAGLLHFRTLRLNLAELHVVKSEDGRYNLDGMEKAVRKHLERRRNRRKGEKAEFGFAGIDQMRFTLRQVRYTDLKRPDRTRSVDLAVEDEFVTTLQTEEDLQYWIGGMVFRILVQQSLRGLDRHPQTPGPQPSSPGTPSSASGQAPSNAPARAPATNPAPALPRP